MAAPRAGADRRSGARTTCVGTGALPRAAGGTGDRLARVRRAGRCTAAGRAGLLRAVRSLADRLGAVRICLHDPDPGPAPGPMAADHPCPAADHPAPVAGRTVATRPAHPGRRERPDRGGSLRVRDDPGDRAGRWGDARTVPAQPLADRRVAGRREGHRTAGALVDRRRAARLAAARLGPCGGPSRRGPLRGARLVGAHRGAARRAAIRCRVDGRPSVDQPRPTSTRRRQR